MPLRRSATVASLATALSLAACSDGSGPSSESPGGILVVRSQAGQQSLWRYDGTDARRISPDSVRFVYGLTRARDGRLAWISMRTTPSPVRYQLTEVAADGRVLRAVPLGIASELHAPPTDLAYSPDGKRLAWRSTRDGFNDSLLVLDEDAAIPRGLASRRARIDVGDRVIAAPPVRWTPAGRIVFGPPGGLVSYQASTGDTVWLAKDLGSVPDYDFTQDGRLAVVTRAPTAVTARVVTQRTSGGNLVYVPLSGPGDPFAVRWTLDGRRIATTMGDSAFVGGQWVRIGVPVLMEIDGSAEPIFIEGVAVAALHGWTTDGRLLFTGADPASALMLRDVFVGAFGGTLTNLTNTTSADETTALALP